MTVSKSAKKATHGPLGFELYKPKKGEEYMCERQLEHFSKLLELWKSQLMEGAKDTVMHLQGEGESTFADPLDRASQEEEFALELRSRDRERKLIKKIDDTLNRIAQGDYGYCEKCGVEIGIGRLEVRPTADLCIDCKTVAEILEKQTGD